MTDDSISRRAAIKLAIDLDYENRGILKESKCREIENRYNMIPSAEQQRWIPVTEILPEDGAEVWVTTEILFDVTRACWHEDSNLWCHPYDSDCLLALRPIAWMKMSIPEPWIGSADIRGTE